MAATAHIAPWQSHLHALVEGLPRRWRPPAGVCAAGVLDGLTLVMTVLPGVAVPTPAAVTRHEGLVESLLEASALLPFRFGTVIPAERLESWLALHRPRFRAVLDGVRGCVEMRVRLLPLDLRAPAPADASHVRTVAERLVERAGIRQWRSLPAGTAASLAFLVARDDVPGFLARIAPVASRAAGLAVVPGGPWPPYSFAPVPDPEPVLCTALAG